MTTERLSGLDATFLYLETSTLHMHVALTAVFDPTTVPGGYSFPRLRRLIADRIPLAPVFQRRLVEVPFRLGHPVWVDDPEFDIDNHLRRAALPSPGGMTELAEFAADVDSRQLPRDRPLWEMWVIEGLAGGNIALMAKMHHSTVDGVSGAALLAVLFDLTPDGPGTAEPAPDHLAGASGIPSDFQLLSQALLARMVQPVEIACTAWRTAANILGVRRIRMHETSGKAALPLTAPRTSINVAISVRRRAAFNAISLDDVKRLKNALGCTVNDVVLALCTGALRDYLIDGDELPDQPLVAVVPVSVDPASHGATGTNKVSAMFVGLPTEEPDPLQRVRLIQESTKGAKVEHQALGADTLQDWAEYAGPQHLRPGRPPLHVDAAGRPAPADRQRRHLQRPGPGLPPLPGWRRDGRRVPLGPVMDGMGLNITIMSYKNVVYWGLVACARAVPRLDEMARHVSTSLAELLGAAGVVPETTTLPLGFECPASVLDTPRPSRTGATGPSRTGSAGAPRRTARVRGAGPHRLGRWGIRDAPGALARGSCATAEEATWESRSWAISCCTCGTSTGRPPSTGTCSDGARSCPSRARLRRSPPPSRGGAPITSCC